MMSRMTGEWVFALLNPMLSRLCSRRLPSLTQYATGTRGYSAPDAQVSLHFFPLPFVAVHMHTSSSSRARKRSKCAGAD
jgi:hypothetical protein